MSKADTADYPKYPAVDPETDDDALTAVDDLTRDDIWERLDTVYSLPTGSKGGRVLHIPAVAVGDDAHEPLCAFYGNFTSEDARLKDIDVYPRSWDNTSFCDICVRNAKAGGNDGQG